MEMIGLVILPGPRMNRLMTLFKSASYADNFEDFLAFRTGLAVKFSRTRIYLEKYEKILLGSEFSPRSLLDQEVITREYFSEWRNLTCV